MPSWSRSGHRVSVITVAYHSDEIIADMLQSLPIEADKIIINNSAPASPQLVELAATHQARLITNSRNQGFGAACNQGAQQSEREFLLFLNPDASLAADCIDRLVAAMDSRPDASAANPRIETSRGDSQHKYRSALLRPTEWTSRISPGQTQEVSVLQGSAMLVRRSDFIRIGGFDEQIFMYHEDDDLSIRLRKQAGPLLVVPAALARHKAGHSSPRTAAMAFAKGFHLGRSRVYALRKHGFRQPRLRCLTQAMLQLLNPISLVIPRKAMKSLGFLIGALQG